MSALPATTAEVRIAVTLRPWASTRKWISPAVRTASRGGPEEEIGDGRHREKRQKGKGGTHVEHLQADPAYPAKGRIVGGVETRGT